MGYTVWNFNGKIDGLNADFVIQFRDERLHLLNFGDAAVRLLYEQYNRELSAAQKEGGSAEVAVIEQWGKRLGQAEDERKQRHDRWLLKVIGPPPYDYNWGFLSSDFDREGNAGVYVLFKYRILELEPGITNIKDFRRIRREKAAHLR